MSMRRPKIEKSAIATTSRSTVIDFKEGYLGSGAVDHLPIEAEPVKDTPVNDTLVKATPVTDTNTTAVTNGMLDDWWKRIKGWFKMEMQNKNTQTAGAIEAQKQLFKMSHGDAKHIEELVDADVDSFSTKYLAGFKPDTMTQVHLDTMVSIGKDVQSNALCHYIQKSSNAQDVPLKNTDDGKVHVPEKKVEAAKTNEGTSSNTNQASPSKTNTLISSKTKEPASSQTKEPASSKTKEPASSKIKEPTSTDGSELDKKVSIRELQPRLTKAVTETLDSYGIHDNGIIDTKKMARMHQLETLLHS